MLKLRKQSGFLEAVVLSMSFFRFMTTDNSQVLDTCQDGLPKGMSYIAG
jgi:hypothetical protein